MNASRLWRCVAALLCGVSVVFLLLLGHPDQPYWAYTRLASVLPGLALMAVFCNFWRRYRFSYRDLSILGLVGYLFMQSQFLGVNVSVFHAHLCLWVSLYFLLRFIFHSTPLTVRGFLGFVMVAGGMEALMGLLQLYGLTLSYHKDYVMTGTFYNPGPYGGFLAVMLSMGLSAVMLCRKTGTRFQCETDTLWGKMFTWIRNGKGKIYLAVSMVFLMAVVLPATGSRAAWVSLGVSLLLMVIREKRKVVATFWETLPSWMRIGCGLLLVVGVVGLYGLKKDSADGRILLFYVTVCAWMKHFLWGVGPRNFGGAYREAQIVFFERHPDSVFADVAGCPAYAFNTYAQMGLEWGLVGLSLFLGIVYPLLKSLLKSDSEKRCVGYGVLTYLLFAFFSYPLQLFPFEVLLVCCMASGSSHSVFRRLRMHSLMAWGIYAVVCVFIGMGWFHVHNEQKAYRDFESARTLYRAALFEESAPAYDRLYPMLQGDADFLYEYGRMGYYTGDYARSLQVLRKNAQIDSDVRGEILMGKNEEALHRYDRAERCYQRAHFMLPMRMYPLYLLAKLYRKTGDASQMEEKARQIVHMRPAVVSPATLAMQAEMQALCDSVDHARGK